MNSFYLISQFLQNADTCGEILLCHRFGYAAKTETDSRDKWKHELDVIQSSLGFKNQRVGQLRLTELSIPIVSPQLLQSYASADVEEWLSTAVDSFRMSTEVLKQQIASSNRGAVVLHHEGAISIDIPTECLVALPVSVIATLLSRVIHHSGPHVLCAANAFTYESAAALREFIVQNSSRKFVSVEGLRGHVRKPGLLSDSETPMRRDHGVADDSMQSTLSDLQRCIDGCIKAERALSDRV